MTRVFNLATQQEVFYWIPPALAVVAAFAQFERRDFNTWDYPKHYWDLIQYTPRTVACGDWCAIL